MIRQITELESYLKREIFGQPLALCSFARAVVRAETGITEKGRPKGAFLLLGPTGVGKTETVKCLARFLYGNENAIARFDMGEFSQADSVASIIGTKQHPEGRIDKALADCQKSGGRILQFDEIEKAHPDVSKLFYAAMDDARISNAAGVTYDLSNYYLIFTSNLGAEDVIHMEDAYESTISQQILFTAKQFFSDALVNRFTEVLIYYALELPTQFEVCRAMLDKKLQHLSKVFGKKIVVNDDEILRHLIKRGFDRMMGARPMRRTIERELGDALCDWHHNKSNSDSDSLVIGLQNDKLVVLEMETTCAN